MRFGRFPHRARLHRLRAAMRAAGDDTPSLSEDAAAPRALLLETRALVNTLAAERDALAVNSNRVWRSATIRQR